MEYHSICVAVLLGWTLFHLLRTLSNRRKLPPGPFPFPVIGNLHLLGEKPHQSLARLAEKYGPVMSLKLGTVNAVIISSPAAAREALQKKDSLFSGSRAFPDAVRAHDHFKNSSVWLPAVSPKWRAIRRFLNSNMFSGVKLESTQQLREGKIQELITHCHMKSQRGEGVDIGREAFKTSMNLLSNTIFSKDLIGPCPDSAKAFKDLVWNTMVDIGTPNLVDYFPFLQKLDPQGVRRRMTRYYGEILGLFKELVDERLEERRAFGAKNVDVLDSILNISQDKPEEIDDALIRSLFLDLFNAGTDTTSSTIEWAMSELLKSPTIMEKAQLELWAVIERGEQVKESDVECLPYLKCIVKETFRMHPATPLLLPRKVEQELVLCGYTIPRGSHILVNDWAMGRDPNLWENPLEFKPERFLGSGVDVRGQDFELIPFGAGRRICPGLPLAMRMVPIMLGSLLNVFQWKIEGDIEPKYLDMEEKFGITLAKARPLIAIPSAI